ncbi:MAG: HEAT repeat domain-containing protein [Acidobacteria bacterium]|nr:HEAT repeat domain-containing protein [Acidobacteriota bacterium]
MTDENHPQNNGFAEPEKPETSTPLPRLYPSRKYPWAIAVVVILFVIIPFFAWYGSWFGRPLSDAQIEQYLNDKQKPRNVQHALSFIGNKLIEGDKTMQRWYPSVINASHNDNAEVRKIAAWTMGQDNTSGDFHNALRDLLKDENAGVRHNAALQLVRFNDASGRSELLAMLEPLSLRSESDGTVELIVSEEGRAVAAHSPLVRIKNRSGQLAELRSPEAGRLESFAVADKATVKAGDTILVLAPSVEQVREALKALYLVGQADDIAAIQRYAGPVSGMPNDVQKQAVNTIEAIRSRTAK